MPILQLDALGLLGFEVVQLVDGNPLPGLALLGRENDGSKNGGKDGAGQENRE